MQGTKVLKIRVSSSLAQQLERLVAAEGLAAAEIVRRAMGLYFQSQQSPQSPQSHLGPAAFAAGEEGAGPGPIRALSGPSGEAPPSSPPPSSPPAPPLTPPSVSPPTAGGLLFPELAGAEPPPPPNPPLLRFPCVADRRTGEAAREWPLPAELVAQWEETFPGMDVLGEARKAREWLLANHRKTYSGMRTFLLRWMCKAQDSGRFMRRAASSRSPGPAARSLEEVYGFASWEAWEATLRQCFAGSELAEELAKLAELRARWEAKHG